MRVVFVILSILYIAVFTATFFFLNQIYSILVISCFYFLHCVEKRISIGINKVFPILFNWCITETQAGNVSLNMAQLYLLLVRKEKLHQNGGEMR